MLKKTLRGTYHCMKIINYLLGIPDDFTRRNNKNQYTHL